VRVPDFFKQSTRRHIFHFLPEFSSGDGACPVSGSGISSIVYQRTRLKILGLVAFSPRTHGDSRIIVTTGNCRAALGLDGRGRPSPHRRVAPAKLSVSGYDSLKSTEEIAA
jgi:hypothetical protein